MKLKSVVTLLALVAFAALTGCGRHGGPGASSEEADARLFKLAQMNGCIECHTVSATSVGPSWLAIAKRYKDAPHAEAKALLINSVMNGSKGKWLTWKGGDGMPPLGRRVAEQDIEQLVDYILSLNQRQ
jgi:cytochrome c551/c552